MNKKYKKLGMDVVFMTLGNFSSRLLSFFMVPFYTSVLSTGDYGIADLITTTINLVLPVFSLGIFEALLRFSLDKNVDKKQVYSISVIIGIAGFIVLILFSPILQLTSMKEYTVYLICYYFSIMMYNQTTAFMKGIDKVAVTSVMGILATFLTLAMNILFLVVIKMGVKGYVLSMILSHLVVAIGTIMLFKLYKFFMPLSRVNKHLLGNMIHYAIPIIPTNLCWWINQSSDKYILSAFWGESILGIYSVSYKIPTIMSTVTSLFVNAWQLSAVEDFGSEQSTQFYNNVYKKYLSFTILISSICILASKHIALIIFQKSFYTAWVYSNILICGYTFNTISSFIGTIYISAKQTKPLFYTVIIGAVVNIILNFLLIPKFAAYGAAIATAISYFITWLVRAIHCKSIIKIEPINKQSTISYIFLIVETIIMCMNLKYSFIITLIITILLFIINRHVFIECIYLIKRKLKSTLQR